jgi:hypothetical protein
MAPLQSVVARRRAHLKAPSVMAFGFLLHTKPRYGDGAPAELESDSGAMLNIR